MRAQQINATDSGEVDRLSNRKSYFQVSLMKILSANVKTSEEACGAREV